MESVSSYYQLPLFLLLIFSIYTIIQLKKAKTQLEGVSIGKAYSWFISSIIFICFWVIFTISQNYLSISFSEDTSLLINNFINPLFLLIAILCIVIGAKKTQGASYSWKGV
ncbi:MAG: hypothetical protein AABW81_03770 [Nanoarchaeota archaeon]